MKTTNTTNTRELKLAAANRAIANLPKYITIVRETKDPKELPTLRVLEHFLEQDIKDICRVSLIYYHEIDACETISEGVKALEFFKIYSEHNKEANQIMDMLKARIWQLEDKKLLEKYWKGE